MIAPKEPIVRVRALIFFERSIVVARELRQGEPQLTLPGGRVRDGETIAEAVLREVQEETGLDVKLGPLLYAAEVYAPHRRHDLNLIFRAVPTGRVERDDLELVSLDTDEVDLVLPPVLGEIAHDVEAGGLDGARWLGNLWDASRAR